MDTTEMLIKASVEKFAIPRGAKTVFAGGRRMTVRTATERVFHLPNGQTVRVSVDDSGVATQVEEGDALHAIVRPRPVTMKMLKPNPLNGGAQ